MPSMQELGMYKCAMISLEYNKTNSLMDFLDPKRKKSHRHRLLYGYILMAIALAMATWILLITSRGFWVDFKTGGIIQNGTVFVDSQPGGSNVILNGQLQGNKTATKLTLPGSQQYSVKLTQEGYRNWSRTLSLDGGKIERLTYPLLIPNKLITTESQLYASEPAFSSQSIDRRWLLVQQPGQTYVFDLYDLNSPANAPSIITIPSGILTDPSKTATLSAVEWSSDNRHLLLKRTYIDGSEFLMIDTQSVSSSVNLNTTLTITPTSISLRDHKYDQMYLYDSIGGIIRLGDLKNRTVSGAILNNVLEYKSFGSDIIMYAVANTGEIGKANIRIRINDKGTYLLKTIQGGNKYLLEIAEFDGTPYFVLGSDRDDAISIYRDPLPTLRGQTQTPLFVTSVLRLVSPQFVTFSENAQFVVAQSANKLVVYNIDDGRQYKTTLSHEIVTTTKISWMDGFRFVYTDKGRAYMIDFDGSNEQALMQSNFSGGPYFAPDFKSMYALAPSLVANGRSALTQTSLVKK
jgi:hypothetical protein